ncbi:MAG: hypothetical protein LUD72_10535 [Bacteroidales bacterium]|nr:hypothetical protein [Bacteroidales bacterium]
MDENLRKSQFLGLYSMVMADGIVQAKELETLYRIGKECYGLSEERINEYVLSSGTSFIAPRDFAESVEFLYHIAEIAWADGELDDTEKSLLSRYAIRLGFQEESAEEIAEWMLEQVHTGNSLDKVLKEIQ